MAPIKTVHASISNGNLVKFFDERDRRYAELSAAEAKRIDANMDTEARRIDALLLAAANAVSLAATRAEVTASGLAERVDTSAKALATQVEATAKAAAIAVEATAKTLADRIKPLEEALAASLLANAKELTLSINGVNNRVDQLLGSHNREDESYHEKMDKRIVVLEDARSEGVGSKTTAGSSAVNYRWIIGLVIATGFSLLGMLGTYIMLAIMAYKLFTHQP